MTLTANQTLAFGLDRELARRGLGLLLLLAGLSVTVYFYSVLPEDPYVYILPYVLPSTLFSLGGILAFGGLRGPDGPTELS